MENPKRVLLVGTASVLQRALARALGAAGHRVSSVPADEVTPELVGDFKPDAVILHGRADVGNASLDIERIRVLAPDATLLALAETELSGSGVRRLRRPVDLEELRQLLRDERAATP